MITKFHQVFPAGHPNQVMISNILERLEEVDRDDIWWIKEIIDATDNEPYVNYYLKRLVDSVEANPQYTYRYILSTLKCINGCWHEEFNDTSLQKFVNDPKYRYLCLKIRDWS